MINCNENQKSSLSIHSDHYVFKNWECGLDCREVIFKVHKGEKYSVHEIRNGRDFIALKIKSKDGFFGWVIHGNKVDLNDIKTLNHTFNFDLGDAVHPSAH